MTMDKAEIVIDYRRAANKQKQIKILAQLNQCAERKIAEILVDAGEELPKVYQDKLQKPERRSRKFPDGEATPADDAPAPVSPADRATDRDLFDAVASLLPEAAARVSPQNAEEASACVDGVGPVVTPSVTAAGGGDSEAGNVARSPRVGISLKEGAKGIAAEDLLRAACRMLTSALDLEPDQYYTYSCGVLDLVHAMTEK